MRKPTGTARRLHSHKSVAFNSWMPLERSVNLKSFAVFHMEGHWDDDGTQMIDAIRRNARNPRIKVAAMPWSIRVFTQPGPLAAVTLDRVGTAAIEGTTDQMW